MSEWLNVAPVEELPAGTFRVVDLEDTAVAVFNVDGEFYAIEDVCTHDYGQLSGGAFEGCEIACPRHGAQFDVRTGEALTPPAYEPVETFPVRVEGEMVQIRDHRDD